MFLLRVLFGYARVPEHHEPLMTRHWCNLVEHRGMVLVNFVISRTSSGKRPCSRIQFKWFRRWKWWRARRYWVCNRSWSGSSTRWLPHKLWHHMTSYDVILSSGSVICFFTQNTGFLVLDKAGIGTPQTPVAPWSHCNRKHPRTVFKKTQETVLPPSEKWADLFPKKYVRFQALFY